MASVVTGFTLAAVVMWWMMLGVVRAFEETVDHVTVELVPVMNLEGEVRKAEAKGLETALSRQHSESMRARGGFDSLVDGIEQDLSTMTADPSGRFMEESAQIGAARAHWDQAIAEFGTALSGDLASDADLSSVLRDASLEVNAMVEQLDLAQASAMAELSESVQHAEARKNTAVWVSLSGLAVGFIAVVAARILFDSDLRKIGDLREHAREMAAGGVDSPLNVEGLTELADLGKSFNAMNKRLHEIDSEREYLAIHDQLTGLANRRSLLDHIDQRRTDRRASGRVDSVVVIEVVRFKDVTDTIGYSRGDRVLIVVAQRIVDCLRNHDTIARMDGAEFAALLEGVSDARAIARIAERLIEAIGEPIDVDEQQLHLSANVGVATSSGSDTAVQVISDAELALHEARGADGASWQIFEHQFRAAGSRRMELESELRAAVSNNDIHLAYQGVFDLEKDNRLVGAEALARWSHSTLGPISPAEFIAIAEQAGFVSQLGWNLLDKACEQMSGWLSAHPSRRDLSIAVNIAATQLEESRFVDRVLSAIETWQLQPSNLVLEVTETMMLKPGLGTHQKLRTLLDVGVGISIDDFGTGYSSLGMVREYPADTLKIDREFVSGVDHDSHKRVLATMIVQLARSIGMRPLAEGVETQAELEILQGMGCDLAQGYLLHRPGPAVELEPLISPRIDPSWTISRNVAPASRAAHMP